MADEYSYPLEKRRHPRTKMEMTLRGIRLDPDGGDVVNTFRSFDVSRGGLGVFSKEPLYPGQRVVLSMPLFKSKGCRTLSATVVRCKSQRGEYRVGLEFDSTSTSSWYSVAGDLAAA